MSEVRLHELPRWSSIAGEQFRMLALSLRNVALLFMGALALGTFFLGTAWWKAQSAPEAHFRFYGDPELVFPLIAAGFFMPLAVWKSEDPSRRSYHWALPVGRAPHTLTRSLFGWIWFVAAIAAYIAWIGVLNQTIGTGAPQNAPQIPVWQWVVPFTAATITYLIGSIVVMSSDHPWRWFVGFPVAMMILMSFSSTLELESFRRGVEAMMEGDWGLQAALTGTVSVREPFTLPDGREVMRSEGRPNFGAWVGATSLWLTIGLAGVLAAAYRHQER